MQRCALESVNRLVTYTQLAGTVPTGCFVPVDLGRGQRAQIAMTCGNIAFARKRRPTKTQSVPPTDLSFSELSWPNVRQVLEAVMHDFAAKPMPFDVEQAGGIGLIAVG